MGSAMDKKRVITSIMLVFLLIGPGSAFALSTTSSGSKLQHLIFIIQENRSLDNYFGTYPGANGLSNAPVCCPASLLSASTGLDRPFHLDINQPVLLVGDELPPGKMYPDAADNLTLVASESAADVRPFLIPDETSIDLNHAWQAAFTDWDHGKMDGFIAGEQSNQTMGYYDRRDIPYYWDYADNFVLDDNFFSSMMGPSFPNHLYIAAGTAGNGTLSNPHRYGWLVNGTVINNPPIAGNDLEISVDLSLTWTALAQDLSERGITWKWYSGAQNVTAPSYWDVLPVFSYFQQHPQSLKDNVVSTAKFVSALKGTDLPSVSWIIPGSAWSPPTPPFTDKPKIQDCSTSEHAPARPDCGMDYVAYLVNSVMKSQYWNSTAIVITWDDYGGFYDHVPPPLVSGDGEGFRVPTLVISPFAKHGYVDHTPYEFSSFLSLVESNFGLPSLGARDSTGIGRNDMMNSFDFNQSPQPALIEPATFVGPGNPTPLSNGYPRYVVPAPTTSSSSSLSSSSQTTGSTYPSDLTAAAAIAVVVVIVAAITTFILYSRRHRSTVGRGP